MRAQCSRAPGRSGRAVDGHRPGRRLAEPGDQLEQRRLAAAARPDQADDRRRFDRERDLVQDVELPEPHLHLRELDPARGSITASALHPFAGMTQIRFAGRRLSRPLSPGLGLPGKRSAPKCTSIHSRGWRARCNGWDGSRLCPTAAWAPSCRRRSCGPAAPRSKPDRARAGRGAACGVHPRRRRRDPDQHVRREPGQAGGAQSSTTGSRRSTRPG